MEKPQKVIFRDKALRAIYEIALYIETKGYPNTAEQFADKLIKFGESLKDFPGTYSVCRYSKFAKKAYRCIVFNKTYIFVYKIENDCIIIYDVIHGKRLLK